MRHEKQTGGEEIALWIVVCIVLALLLMATGCTSTVTPPPVVDRVPSFDGNEQTSGFLGYHHTGAGIITDSLRERYNLLVARYSDKFNPPLTPDAGITPYAFRNNKPTWLIDAEHLVKFRTMNRWRKEGVL